MQIFLSYASEHRDIADQIQISLAGGGHQVFFDRDDLPSGGDYDARISAAVAQSDLMVFLVSNASVEKGSYALTELKFARHKWPSPKDRVLPVMIETVAYDRIPIYLKAVTVLEPEGSVPAEIRAAVSEMIEAWRTSPPPPPIPPGEDSGSTTGHSSPFSFSRRQQLAALGAGTLLAAAGGAIHYTGGSIRHLLNALSEVKQIPLNAGIRNETEKTVIRLVPVVRNFLLEYQGNKVTPWEMAQGVMAIPRSEMISADAFVQYVRGKYSAPPCACWTELLGKPNDGLAIYVSGWVLSALARLKVEASVAEIRFLLDNQKKDGWWSVFPSGGGAEHASAYATAWAMLGLHFQRPFAKALLGEMNDAVARGSAWLLAAREGARWRHYPKLASSKFSTGVSGTVLHALHLLGNLDLAKADASWLDSLPHPVVDQSDSEYHVIPGARDNTNSIEMLSMPWSLVATVDAYPAGTVGQKSRTLAWIEEVLSDRRIHEAPMKETRSWWRAELLYALRYAT